MQSALNAREMVLSQYEDAQIEVIDATVNTVLQGLFVLEAVSMREEGMTLSEAVAALDEMKESGRKNRKSGRSCGFRAGNQAHYYPEAGRDISERNIEEQKKID